MTARPVAVAAVGDVDGDGFGCAARLAKAIHASFAVQDHVARHGVAILDALAATEDQVLCEPALDLVGQQSVDECFGAEGAVLEGCARGVRGVRRDGLPGDVQRGVHDELDLRCEEVRHRLLWWLRPRTAGSDDDEGSRDEEVRR